MMKFKFNLNRQTVYFLLLCFFASTGFAQESFFTTQQTRTSQLTDSQRDVFERAWNPEIHASSQFVDVGRIGDVLRTRTIYLDVGNECGPVTLRVKTIEVTDEDNYYIYADASNYSRRAKCRTSSLMLRSQNGERFGLLKMGKDIFQIEALGEGQTALIQARRPRAGQPNLTCEVEHPAESHSHEEHIPGHDLEQHLDGQMGSRAMGCNVRVLFLFTYSASSNVSNMSNHAQAHIDQANQALANSGITANQLRFSLAAAVLYIDVNEAGKTALQVLTETQSSYNGPLLRNVYNADLVCVVANDQIGNFGTTAGIAYAGSNENPTPNYLGYSMINLTNNLGNHIFTHEVGHNMGGKHEDTDPALISNAHDFTWTTGILFWTQNHRGQTAIWSTISNSDGLLNYSNPDVDHEGQATGTANANNAQVLRSNACTVANYRSSPPAVNASLSGPVNACLDDTPCFSAMVSGGTPPYSYAWEWSSNGSGYNYFGSGTSSCLSMAGFSNGQTLSIRLTVYSQGQPYRFSRSLIVGANGPNPCFGKVSSFDELELSDDGGAENTLILAPNPAKFNSEALLYLVRETQVQINIYSLTGQLVQEGLAKKLGQGNHRIDLDLVEVPSGMYLLKVESEDFNLVQRLMVNR